MKNLKKAASLILAVMMILSLQYLHSQQAKRAASQSQM